MLGDHLHAFVEAFVVFLLAIVFKFKLQIEVKCLQLMLCFNQYTEVRFEVLLVEVLVEVVFHPLSQKHEVIDH